MEITSTQMPIATSVRTASGFAMPTGAPSCIGLLADARDSWIPATGLSLETTDGSVLRDRQDLVARGHVAFIASVSGHPAWSPPIC